jgi:4-hydroxybenzoate polyprenyltransferase
MLRRWQLVALTAVGLALGAAYSVEPVRLKGRGLAQLVCLWLIIFVGPMVMIATLFDIWPSPALLAFATAYGAVQMGIILVNTAEDYPEDQEAKVRTVIVTLGLPRGIGLASGLVLAGSIAMLITLAALYATRRVSITATTALIPVVAACIWLASGIYRLSREVNSLPLQEAIVRVKQKAKLVPAWVTVVAWTSLIAVLVLFLSSSHLI